MKVYLVKHKNSATLPGNMCAWAAYDNASTYVVGVVAFLKKRSAADYIAKLPESVRPYREIVVFCAQERARTRRKPVGKGNARKSAATRQNARKRETEAV